LQARQLELFSLPKDSAAGIEKPAAVYAAGGDAEKDDDVRVHEKEFSIELTVGLPADHGGFDVLTDALFDAGFDDAALGTRRLTTRSWGLNINSGIEGFASRLFNYSSISRGQPLTPAAIG
jgi:hypothetical protein